MSSRPHHVRHLSLGLRMALLPALLAVVARLLVVGVGVHGQGLASALALGLAVLLGIALPVDWLRRRRAPATHARPGAARGGRARSARHRSR
ncbi:hypothetical protein [Roseisolibacter agri]|uniref:Uncharacterized protein n=1 Tax=Roseisolibacter agri TaxID=2014610 RepID=A0AA37Q1A6_9BACT|nr:hypothetical protein [Roseisolibacter agri]GLC24679.1 hypothetical protein rosag_11920 [Roseisolibacter agri]